jgi:transposase
MKLDPETIDVHGRKPASAFSGAPKVEVKHPTLTAGDRCPECWKGKVYPLQEPAVRVRIIGQAPVQATVYELARLRCNLCQEVYTAPPPEQACELKREETAASMVAVLKYGSGVPFYRLAGLQAQFGMPLPDSTQWDMMEQAAALLAPGYEELIRQAAQGQVLYNDDTAMRILSLQRETPAERTGVFTTGIVAMAQGRKLVLFASRVETARGGTARTDPDVRCPVAQRAQGLHRDPGQLSHALPPALCGSGCQLHYRMPVCAGDVGESLRSRRRGPEVETDRRGAVGGSSGEERSADGAVAAMGAAAVGRTQSGSQLGVGAGDHVHAQTLGEVDAVPAASGSAAGFQHRGEGVEEGDSASQKRLVFRRSR